MRAIVLLLTCLAVSGCSNSPSAASPTREGELLPAWDAYRAYCGLCPGSAGCCLHQTDFVPARYTAQAGPYLRALREHFECRRGDTLIDATLYSSTSYDLDARPPYGVDPAQRVGSTSPRPLYASCEQYACDASREVMVQELDRALAVKTPHATGAALLCASSTK